MSRMSRIFYSCHIKLQFCEAIFDGLNVIKKSFEALILPLKAKQYEMFEEWAKSKKERWDNRLISFL